MLLRRTQISSASEYLNMESITRIWANDGWCYIPEQKKRQQFFDTENGILLKSETYDGIIPLQLHWEALVYMTSPEHPQSWVEMGNGWGELYEVIPTTQSK